MGARTTLAGAVTALLLVAGACDSGGSGGKSSDGTSTTANFEEQVVSEPRGRLSVTASGDVEFDFDGEVKFKIVSINDPDVSALQFLSVGIERLERVSGNRWFTIAFDLGGRYEGEGEYEIRPIGESSTPTSLDPDNPGAAASSFSRAILNFNAEGNPVKNPDIATKTQVFDKALETCTVVVHDDDGRSGEMHCPRLANADGDTVDVTMEWEA